MQLDAIEVVKCFWERVWNEGDAELLSEILTPDVRENGEALTVEDFKRAVVSWRQVFPDFAVRVDEMIRVGEERVVSRVTYTGTQMLPWAGLPAAGRTFEVVGIDIFRVRNGRVIEFWHAVDHLDMAAQLGARLAPKDPAGEG